MARNHLDQGVTPSMLDRLIDPESAGTSFRRGYGMEQMMVVVRRDLENLLNTRLSVLSLPEGLPELTNSVQNYGLPDFGSIATSTPQAQEAIARTIERAIQFFEPRLRDPHVHLVRESSGGEQLTLKFQIEARLAVAPFPDVAFETVLELATGYTSIRETRG